MDYHFRIYYLVKDYAVLRKIKEKFSTTISVNYESYITTDKVGADLLFETEKRGFIKIRSYGRNNKEIIWESIQESS